MICRTSFLVNTPFQYRRTSTALQRYTNADSNSEVKLESKQWEEVLTRQEVQHIRARRLQFLSSHICGCMYVAFIFYGAVEKTIADLPAALAACMASLTDGGSVAKKAVAAYIQKE